MVSAAAPNSRPDVPGGKRARFARGMRLLRHSDFERVYKKGRRHFAAHITVFYLGRGEGTGARVGFTVGKALGGAVDRNRMKRRLREAVRLHWPDFQAAVDVVIHPKKAVLKLGFPELGREIQRAYEVIGKFAEKP